MRRLPIVSPRIFLLMLSVISFLLWIFPTVSGDEPEKPQTVIIVRPEDVPTYVAQTGAVGAKMLLTQEKFYLGTLTMKPEAKVPAHHHETENEIIYCIKGAGVLTSNGKEYKIGPGMVVMIPPKVEHSFRVISPFKNFEAIQMWIPGGPSKKYLDWSKVK